MMVAPAPDVMVWKVSIVRKARALVSFGWAFDDIKHHVHDVSRTQWHESKLSHPLRINDKRKEWIEDRKQNHCLRRNVAPLSSPKNLAQLGPIQVGFRTNTNCNYVRVAYFDIASTYPAIYINFLQLNGELIFKFDGLFWPMNFPSTLLIKWVGVAVLMPVFLMTIYNHILDFSELIGRSPVFGAGTRFR